MRPVSSRRLGEQAAQLHARRLGKGDVRHDAAAEEGVLGAPAGAVEELRRQHHVPVRVFLLQAAHRGDADEPAHAERAQGVDIGAMIQLVRHDAMPAPVPRQKIDLPAREAPAHDHLRRIAPRRRDAVLRHVGQPLHMVKAAAADHADGWFLHARGVNRLRRRYLKPKNRRAGVGTGLLQTFHIRSAKIRLASGPRACRTSAHGDANARSATRNPPRKAPLRSSASRSCWRSCGWAVRSM